MAQESYDLVVVGAGPAGLQASIMAESERIKTAIFECSGRLGGQAATTSNIENYAGFPDGISGDVLMDRMIDHASRFKANFLAPLRVADFESVDDGIVVYTDNGESYLGRYSLLSSGVEHRLLRARNLAVFLGRGASYYPPPQKSTFPDSEAFVVGGGNSAGQAAMHLSSCDTCKVHLLVRGESIEDKMSGYLVDEISEKPNIEVHTKTQLLGVDGNGVLQSVSLEEDGQVHDMPANQVFVLIGSEPKTMWLPEGVIKDVGGFVLAGSDLAEETRNQFMEQTQGRPPLANETSIPGLFVAGDVRSGTYKRVVLAAADGGNVIPQLHRLRSIQSTKR
jgi:thioredoxin reductase (NADPH)